MHKHYGAHTRRLGAKSVKQMTKKRWYRVCVQWSLAYSILVQSAQKQSSWIAIDALGLVLATGQYVRSRLVVDGHCKTRSHGDKQWLWGPTTSSSSSSSSRTCTACVTATTRKH
ncbi:hypothetical protein ACQKWADRAFT_277662 [Trichoderma austrokoningii]